MTSTFDKDMARKKREGKRLDALFGQCRCGHGISEHQGWMNPHDAGYCHECSSFLCHKFRSAPGEQVEMFA